MKHYCESWANEINHLQLVQDFATIHSMMTGWWFGTFFMFPNILGKIIIPTDVHIFQRGRYTTTTTNQMRMESWYVIVMLVLLGMLLVMASHR